VPRPDQLVHGIRTGDRRALARAITLAESTRSDHRDLALEVIDALLPRGATAIRVGVSGAPGVGKSTFIEALGLHVIQAGHQVAVLAVDPSSRRSGGSILADKTRMTELAKRREAFIRPSPSGGSVGGVARRTREAMLLCEAFGFDVVIVETVGVGQSESAVDDLVDAFVLLVQPGAGDDLQSIKRGVVESADIVAVTKADGEWVAAAGTAAVDYHQALGLLRAKTPAWTPTVVVTSALTGDGIPDVWLTILEHRRVLEADGSLDKRRRTQAKAWLWSELTEETLARFRLDPVVAARLPEFEAGVIEGRISPGAAARALLRTHASPSAGLQSDAVTNRVP
jgi:LAO/AO transport system kinase